MSVDADYVLKTVEPKSDQLNADDLIGGPVDVTIREIRKGAADQPLVLVIDGGRQPYKPCKSMRRVLIRNWGSSPEAWVGRSLRVFVDPEVTWAGQKVGGIRISHMSHIERPMDTMLTVARGKRVSYRVEPLVVETPDLADRIKRAVDALGNASSREEVDRYKRAIDRDLLPNASAEQRAMLEEAISAALLDDHEGDSQGIE